MSGVSFSEKYTISGLERFNDSLGFCVKWQIYYKTLFFIYIQEKSIILSCFHKELFMILQRYMVRSPLNLQWYCATGFYFQALQYITEMTDVLRGWEKTKTNKQTNKKRDRHYLYENILTLKWFWPWSSRERSLGPGLTRREHHLDGAHILDISPWEVASLLGALVVPEEPA